MTGWPEGLLQDDCAQLSKWLANKPEARQLIRQVIDEIEYRQKRSQGVSRRVLSVEEVLRARTMRATVPAPPYKAIAHSLGVSLSVAYKAVKGFGPYSNI